MDYIRPISTCAQSADDILEMLSCQLSGKRFTPKESVMSVNVKKTYSNGDMLVHPLGFTRRAQVT